MAYTDSLEEADKVLMKWLSVIEDFCHCHNRLNHLIRDTNTSSFWKPDQRTTQLRKLFQLREQVSETTATLLRDMNPALTSSQSLVPLHTKLQVHTRLLYELNQKINAELSFTQPIAYA